MRTRIQTKVNIDEVIDSIERRVNVYTECVKDLMTSEGIDYHQARAIIKKRVIERMIFKQSL